MSACRLPYIKLTATWSWVSDDQTAVSFRAECETCGWAHEWESAEVDYEDIGIKHESGVGNMSNAR